MTSSVSMPSGSQPGILFVCTGNIARSPFLEYTLRSRLADTDAAAIPIRSAGTLAVTTGVLHPLVAAELDRRGIDPMRFSPSQLTARTALDAGLILTASRDHRRQVARVAPERRNVTFTLRQFVRLIQLDPIGELRFAADGPLQALAQLASRNRGLSSGSEDADDVADPIRGNRRTFAAAFEAMDPAVDVLAGLLSGLKVTAS